jgi:hypothetical protein
VFARHKNTLKHIQFDNNQGARLDGDGDDTIDSLHDYPVLETLSLPMVFLLGYDPEDTLYKLPELLPPSLKRLRLMVEHWPVTLWSAALIDLVKKKPKHTPNLELITIRGYIDEFDCEDLIDPEVLATDACSLGSVTESEVEDMPGEWESVYSDTVDEHAITPRLFLNIICKLYATLGLECGKAGVMVEFELQPARDPKFVDMYGDHYFKYDVFEGETGRLCWK